MARLDNLTQCVQDELDAYRHTKCDSTKELATAFKLSVIIPVFNEKNTIGRVIARVAALPLTTELIVVDDFSTDGTREILEQLSGVKDFKVILKEQNEGKGAALRTGLKEASGDYVVIQDADLEYDPRDIPSLLIPLIKGEADIVYGSRFIGE